MLSKRAIPLQYHYKPFSHRSSDRSGSCRDRDLGLCQVLNSSGGLGRTEKSYFGCRVEARSADVSRHATFTGEQLGNLSALWA